MHLFIIIFVCQDHVRPSGVSNYCCFPQRVHFLLEFFLFLPMNYCWDERNTDNRALHPTFLSHLCICTVGSYASVSVRLSDVRGPKTRKSFISCKVSRFDCSMRPSKIIYTAPSAIRSMVQIF